MSEEFILFIITFTLMFTAPIALLFFMYKRKNMKELDKYEYLFRKMSEKEIDNIQKTIRKAKRFIK